MIRVVRPNVYMVVTVGGQTLVGMDERDHAAVETEWVENGETPFAEGPFGTYGEALGAAFEDSESTLLRNSPTSKLQGNIMAAWAVA